MKPAPSPPDRLLASLDRAFASIAGDDARIDVSELKKALGVRTEYIARRMHALFDRDGDGFVSKAEFLEAVRTLTTGSVRDKLAFAFRLHDHDGDGTLSREELRRMILIALAEDDVTFDERHADALVERLFAEADRNRDGRIAFDEFEALMMRHPHLVDAMTRGEARWVLPNEELLDRLEGARSKASGGHMLGNRRREILWVAAWAVVNVALFASGLVPHGARKSTPMNQVSHAATSCILWNTACILLPVLRRFLTWVRRTPAGRVVPVDDAIDFHRLVGHTLFGFAALHVVAMLEVYAAGASSLAAFAGKLQTGRAITGLLLFGVFAIMWFFARKAVRRSKRFELFYFTHLLYVGWFALAFAHASSFFAWAGLPVVGLAIELGVRKVRRARATTVRSGSALRSGVTRLELARPAGFVHRPGDYLFLRVPAVARHEWHPFTISSAPESQALTVHVRALGNWSSALRRLVERSPPREPLEAFVDGPYGAPSGDIFESSYAVLVGAGIGVTPFASVLESLVLRANGRGEWPSKLKRVHFYWLNRDQFSFEWFSALLAELERVDRAGLLSIRVFMTDGRPTASAAALEVARELAHGAGMADVVTGLRAKTNMGAPDWNRELEAIVAEHAPARVDLFFCGPSGLGRKVRGACERVGVRYREERF